MERVKIKALKKVGGKRKSMRDLNTLLEEYSLSHQNQTNVVIHKIFVPLIMFSVLGLLFALPKPALLESFGMNWALLALLGVFAYYLILSRKYFLLILPFLALMYAGVVVLAAEISILWFSSILFVISWGFQFVGHKIEGKKPSFLNDLLFLLIGPLWVVKSLFRLS